ncbi:MAG TPA: septum site-determining protein MinC [Rhodanobacteraceae bacterium]|jgi:septum site-determining protein MinC|nr:septum site-determining protein MinC [Rhodanobacteraceae bacterium]
MAASPGVILEPVADIKFGQVGIANLRLKRFDPEELQRELVEKVKNAPNLFQHAPVVVDLSHLAELPDLEAVRDLFARIKEAGMAPVGLSYGTTENEQLARALDVPLFAKFRAAFERDGRSEPVVEAPKPRERRPEPEPAPQIAAQSEAAAVIGLVHDKPVRSGQQVYARGRDLVLTKLVANGAEVIADGSIHVYGALRGRALAGAQGDASARIYCHEFHAELVSIAGQYRVFETMPSELRGQRVQAWLDGDKLMVQKL